MKKKHIITVVLTVILFAFALYVFSEIIIAKKENRPTTIFGVTLHVVKTDSMSPEINVGDYLIAKVTSIDTVKVGDDVVFVSPDPALNKMLIVHRVTAIETKDGKVFLTTQGIKQGAPPDAYPVTEIVGVKLVKSAFLGQLYLMFTSPFGIIILVIVVVCIGIAATQIKKIVYALRDKDKTPKPKDDGGGYGGAGD